MRRGYPRYARAQPGRLGDIWGAENKLVHGRGLLLKSLTTYAVAAVKSFDKNLA